MEELAFKIEVSKTAIGKWESDASKPNIENLLKLCDFLSDRHIFSPTGCIKYNNIT